MTNNLRRPSSITMENPEFPYLVAEENREVTSFIAIAYPRDRYEDEPNLFYLLGASLTMRDNGEVLIELRHSFACDEESDRSTVGRFTVQNLILKNAYSHSMMFSAFLTSAQFYPEGYEDGKNEPFNPFAGAVEKDEDTDPYANTGYPYLPPTTTLAGLSFPVQVEMTLHYDRPDATEDVLRYMAAHRQARQDRAVAAEVEQRKEDARKEQRRVAREAYLLTEDGKTELAQDAVRDRLRNIEKGDSYTNEQLIQLTEDGSDYVQGLNLEDQKRLQDGGANSITRLGKGDTGRIAFLEGFINALKEMFPEDI